MLTDNCRTTDSSNSKVAFVFKNKDVLIRKVLVESHLADDFERNINNTIQSICSSTGHNKDDIKYERLQLI